MSTNSSQRGALKSVAEMVARGAIEVYAAGILPKLTDTRVQASITEPPSGWARMVEPTLAEGVGRPSLAGEPGSLETVPVHGEIGSKRFHISL